MDKDEQPLPRWLWCICRDLKYLVWRRVLACWRALSTSGMHQGFAAVKDGLGVAGLCLLRAGLRLYAALRLMWESQLVRSASTVTAGLARITTDEVPAWGRRGRTLTLSLLFDLVRSASPPGIDFWAVAPELLLADLYVASAGCKYRSPP